MENQAEYKNGTLSIEERITKYIAAIEQIDEGRRNHALHNAGLLLRGNFGKTGVALVSALSEVNQSKCNPPLEDSEVLRIVQSVDKSDIPAGENATASKGQRVTKASTPKQRTVYTVSISDTAVQVVDLLQKEVCIYANCLARVPNEKYAISKMLEAFRTGGKSKDRIEAVRSEADKEKRSKLKQQLPAIIFGSEPQEERKATACKPNGMLALDFDSIPADKMDEAKATIAAKPYVVAVVLSVSGNGYFALVAYEGTPNLKSLIVAMQADFPDHTLDKSCSDVSRLRIVTLDPNLIIKDEVFPAVLTEQTETMDAPDDNDPLQADTGKWDIDVTEKIGIEVLDSLLQQIETIPFSKSEGGKVGHCDYYICGVANLLRIAKLHSWDIGMKNGIPYFYNGWFWQWIDEDTFRHFLQAVGIKQGIPHRVIKDHLFVDKMVKQFASEARFPVPSADGTPKINLLNGTLHFMPSGVELEPFNKQDGLTYQLHYPYDKEAKAPIFEKFLNTALPNVAVQKLVFQYIAYVFLPKMNLEKLLFLFGGGSNGKSVLLAVIKALVGDKQCCEYALEGITESEYQRAELGKYLLNTCTEISTRMGTAIFKKIASREPLQARLPYGKPYNVNGYATSIFSMNVLPKDVEQTAAFFRRFIIVPFETYIPDDKQDTTLAKKIIDSEMSGVLNLVIEGMESLLSEGKFDIPESVQRVVEEFRKESDSILTFLDEGDGGWHISTEHWKSLQEMYTAYRAHCTTDGGKPVSKRTFGQRLRALGYTVEKRGHFKQTMVNAENAEDIARAEKAKQILNSDDVPV